MTKPPRVLSATGNLMPVLAHRTAKSRPAKAVLVLALLAALPVLVHAVPSFARQFNVQCITCHTEFPVLNDMGRLFKLTGYTMSAEQSMVPALAAMVEPSFTHTQAGQDDNAAPGFGRNNNYATTQVSIFYAGRLFGPYASHLFRGPTAAFLNKIGIFSQVTYDGVGKVWSWDNVDLRYADNGTIAGHSVLWGIDLNNNPTVQDPWNSLPAWGFPFAGSGLAPTPGAAPLIDGGLGQQVAGLGAYAMVDSKFYLDFSAYNTLPTRVQRGLGVDPVGETQLARLAPYGRIAYTRPAAAGTWETGVFGLVATSYPGRDRSEGTDRIADFGVDSQFQKSIGADDLTVLVTYISERSRWSASQALGNTENATGSLNEFKASCHLLADKTCGFAVQYFRIAGSRDALAYADSPEHSPNSDGEVLEFDYLPWNKTVGPAFWPRSNVKFSVQYTAYNHFDGSKSDVGGTGRPAKDNNTLYLQAWYVF